MCNIIGDIYILVDQNVTSTLDGNCDLLSLSCGTMNLNFKVPIILCKGY